MGLGTKTRFQEVVDSFQHMDVSTYVIPICWKPVHHFTSGRLGATTISDDSSLEVVPPCCPSDQKTVDKTTETAAEEGDPQERATQTTTPFICEKYRGWIQRNTRASPSKALWGGYANWSLHEGKIWDQKSPTAPFSP